MLERIMKEESESLLKELKAKESSSVDISDRDYDRLTASPISIEFNEAGNIDKINDWFESVELNILFFKRLKDRIGIYLSDVLLTSEIEKRKLYNDLKQVEKELKVNQKQSYASYFVGFNNFNFLNFRTYLDWLKPTSSFIDLKNKKALNQRVDNKVEYDFNTIVDMTNVRTTNDNIYDVIESGLFHTDCIKQNNERESSVSYELVLKEPVMANRFVIDSIYAKNMHLKVTLKNDSSSIVIIDTGMFKTFYDRVMNNMEVQRIIIEITNTDNEDYSIGFKKIALYNDTYQSSSILCTKPIDVGNVPFKVHIESIEFTNTKIHVLVGLIKDNKITWKGYLTDEIINEYVDSVIVQCQLEGTTNKSPVIEYISVDLMEQITDDTFLSLDDYKE